MSLNSLEEKSASGPQVAEIGMEEGGENFEGGVWVTVQPEYAVRQHCSNDINHYWEAIVGKEREIAEGGSRERERERERG